MLCCLWEFFVVVLLDMNVFFKFWAIELVSESTRDTYNYGQYLNQFPPNTIKVIREFERIQKRICRHKISIMFNEICINEEMVPKYTYIYIYIYIYTHSKCHFFRRRPSLWFCKSTSRSACDTSSQEYPFKLIFVYDNWISCLFHWHCLHEQTYAFSNLLQPQILWLKIDMSYTYTQLWLGNCFNLYLILFTQPLRSGRT